MPQHDIAIVGAGILGCMIAREVMSRAPGASVVLLDRDLAGSGTSRRSAGLHLPCGATDRLRRMSAYSQDYYEKLKQADPTLPIYPLGMSVVASVANVAGMRAAYLASANLTRVPDVAVGPVRAPRHAEVWTGDGCQYADVYALVQAIAQDLRPVLRLREGVRVTAVEPTDEGAVLRLGTGEVLTARQVVVAPGPWLHDAAWKALVAPLGLRVKKVVALHIEQAPAASDPVIMFNDDDNAFLLPVRHRGHWLFSYTCQEWDVDPDAQVTGVDSGHLADAHAILRRYAPGFAEQCGTGRVCSDAYSETREPVLRALDEHGHVIFAGAANGSGYRLAPAMASAAVDLLHI
jgi:glycine/D-amino acid oxidase-like deaminating enzyme